MTKVTLKDISESCLGKMLDQKKNKGTPQFYLGNKNVRWGGFDLDNLQKMPFEEHETNRYSIEKGDLVICEGGEPGRCAIWESDDHIMFQKALHRVRFVSGVNNYYVYYWLLYAGKRGLLDKYCTGSTIKHLPGDKLKSIIIELPDEITQNRIADLLNCLDRKIKLNSAINQNLAEQIRTLCNAWIIDYEPFGGKCPDNWETTQLSSIAKFTSGYSYKGNELQPSSVAMATIKNFDRNGGFKLDGYKEIVPSSKLKAEHHAKLFDTLVAHTDLTQNADVIGNAEPILSLSGYDDIVYSMDLVKVTPNNPYISKFLIAAILQTQSFKAHCLGYVNGTTVLHMSKKALPEYSLVLPSDLSILKPLDEVVASMYQQMAAQIDESMKLQRLRDTLLPKLMSGELDVSEIDL